MINSIKYNLIELDRLLAFLDKRTETSTDRIYYTNNGFNYYSISYSKLVDYVCEYISKRDFSYEFQSHGLDRYYLLIDYLCSFNFIDCCGGFPKIKKSNLK